MIISFSGLDGSGKSTHIDLTVDFLRKEGIRTKVIEIYGMSFFSIMGSFLNRLSKKHAQSLVAEQFRIEEKLSIKKKYLSLVRRFSLFLDILIFCTFIKFPAKIKHRHVICDRYFYDTVIQLFYLKMCSKQFYENALKWIPMPDIPIIILVEPNIAFGRKVEYDREYFHRKDILYRDIAKKKINYKVIISEGLDETQREIEKIIKAKIHRKEKSR